MQNVQETTNTRIDEASEASIGQKKQKSFSLAHGVLFSDEELFLLQDSHNQQNGRVNFKSFANVPREKPAVEKKLLECIEKHGIGNRFKIRKTFSFQRT